MALIKIAFSLSNLKFCFSVRVQMRGMISFTPISVAFSKNHSKREVFLINEMAIATFRFLLSSITFEETLTTHFFGYHQ